MKLLVTGAGGFLGRHAVSGLRARPGHRVTAVSRTRRPEGESLRIDLTDPASFSRLPVDLDAVVHLAAHVPAREGEAEPEACFRDNAQATLTLLEFAARHGIRRFVLASTCSVCGESPERQPQREEDPPRPENAYALSKLASETLAEPYAFVHGLDVTVLRFPYIYGSGMRPDTVVETFIRRARDNEPIPLYNEGGDCTDLLYVKDAVTAVEAALCGPPGVYNIGSGVAVSIRELAVTIIDLTASSSTLEVQPRTRPGRKVVLDIEKAAGTLGWRPRYDLSAGLRDLLAASG